MSRNDQEDGDAVETFEVANNNAKSSSSRVRESVVFLNRKMMILEELLKYQFDNNEESINHVFLCYFVYSGEGARRNHKEQLSRMAAMG